MSISRRELLRRASMFGAASMIPSFAACAPKGEDAGDDEVGDTGETGSGSDSTETGGDDLPTYEWDGELGPETLFSHGVASGDPLVDAVILWTRVSPSAEGPVDSFFEVALDPAFENRVAADYIAATDIDRDYTIKLDLFDLVPETSYYYRFYAQGRVSPIGRTRTAPVVGSRLRMVVTSCASYGHGYFHAYRDMAGRADIDVVLQLGDYIYEFASGTYGDIREYEPLHEIVTLDDYRIRYQQYRSDLDLQEAHRQHPFVTTWDDHEIANDGWVDGAENHDPVDEGPWADRRSAATQAYFEWLPIREGVEGRLYRHLPYGNLVDLFVLDTRYEGREQQITLTDPDGLTQINAPGRQLLGATQETWVFDQLSSSVAVWKLLAQQVMIGQFLLEAGADGEPHRPLFADGWDGYVDARTRLLQYIEDESITNVVVLTGDIHSSFANEVTYDPLVGYDPETGEGSVAVEFVTPAITSPGLGFPQSTLDTLALINPHTRWLDGDQHGYLVLDVTAERIQSDWWHIGGAVGLPEFTSLTWAKSFSVQAGSPLLIEEAGPVEPKPDAPVLAP